MKWDLITSAFRRESENNDAGREPTIVHSPSLAPNTPQAPVDQKTVFIARQPIFDGAENVCAYQLFIRQAGDLPETPPHTVDQSARLIVDTLNNFGVQAVLGNRLGWITLPERMLDSDIVDFLPSSNVVLEYPATFLNSPEAEARCAHLLKQGHYLALACTDKGLDLAQLPRVASHIIYDFAHLDLKDIAKLDRTIHQYGLVRLARNINTRADFEACKKFGFDVYQGNFFAKAETIATNRIDPSRARIVEIFNLVMNKADISVIEDAFKHDVALCYSLLCYINSVGIGMQYKVASIRNAIMLLGYEFLWRWLSLLVYAGIDLSAAQRVLLNTAIIRGRLTELLGQINLPDKEANALFVVGNFTLLDALLGIPMEQALKRINLPRDIASAILQREGRYAPYLELALAFESNQLAKAELLCAQLNIDPNAASRAHLAAIEWANVVAK
jgi:EAL and modified HD-GYP domain-containing signal transduction protein